MFTTHNLTRYATAQSDAPYVSDQVASTGHVGDEIQVGRVLHCCVQRERVRARDSPKQVALSEQVAQLTLAYNFRLGNHLQGCGIAGRGSSRVREPLL